MWFTCHKKEKGKDSLCQLVANRTNTIHGTVQTVLRSENPGHWAFPSLSRDSAEGH